MLLLACLWRRLKAKGRRGEAVVSGDGGEAGRFAKNASGGIGGGGERFLVSDISEWLDKYRVFKVEELERGTGCFDDAHLIQGSVYKANIDGEVFAVKKMNWDTCEELRILQKQPGQAGGLLHQLGDGRLLPGVRVRGERLAGLVAPGPRPRAAAELARSPPHRPRPRPRPPVHPRAHLAARGAQSRAATSYSTPACAPRSPTSASPRPATTPSPPTSSARRGTSRPSTSRTASSPPRWTCSPTASSCSSWCPGARPSATAASCCGPRWMRGCSAAGRRGWRRGWRHGWTPCSPSRRARREAWREW